MSEEVGKDVMTSSVMSVSGDSVVTTNSDNESWTILDEEEEDMIPPHDSTIINHEATANPVIQESDSDIETLEQQRQQESNLESLNSDGIPVGVDLSEAGEQYIWSNESLEEPEDDDDLELIEEEENQGAVQVDALSSGYPPEELVEHFPQIIKGRTYLHQPNQALNLYLTATLVVVAAMVIGVGVGHFKGWSERLELQEQYADIREERMDKLTESLVNCMTGEEGRGGDDQDLDDRVIRQLQEENERLKFELEVLRDSNDDDLSTHEEMTAILRDRINDLLVANSHLEKEVVRLRYAPKDSMASSLEAKVSLNTMQHENDQLRLAIAKERYGPREVPIEAKEQLNILKTENDELKTEVRKFRYGVHSLLSSGNLDLEDPAEFEDFEEDFNATRNFDSHDEPNFITLNRLQAKPVLPPVILLGGKIQNPADDLEDIEDDLSLEKEEEEEEEPAEKREYFKSFRSFMKENVNPTLDLVHVGKVIDEFKKNAQDLIPDETKVKIKQSAQDLSSTLKDKWAELGLMEEKKKVDKLAKTILKALGKAKDIVAEEFAPDVDIWSSRLSRVQDKFQTKWQEVMAKFALIKPKKGDDDRSCEKATSNLKKKQSSSWSKKNMSSHESWMFKRAAKRENARKESIRSDWIFDRASSRKRFHNLLSEAEWYNRKFYSKRCDQDGNCRNIDQDFHGRVSHGKAKKTSSHARGETEALNKGQDFVFPNRQGKKAAVLSRLHDSQVDDKRIFFAHDDDNDHDDDDDEDEEENVKLFIRDSHGFARPQKRGYESKQNFHGQEQWKKSKKSEKRGRFHHRNHNHRSKFFDDNIVHFMHNKVN